MVGNPRVHARRVYSTTRVTKYTPLIIGLIISRSLGLGQALRLRSASARAGLTRSNESHESLLSGASKMKGEGTEEFFILVYI